MEKTMGCPKCGNHSLISVIRYCPRCYGQKLVPGTKAEFNLINSRYAKTHTRRA